MASKDRPEAGTKPSEEPTLSQLPVEPMRPASARVEFGARTHVGKVRPNNEDHFLIARLSKSMQVLETSLSSEQDSELADPEAFLMLVADGMGGHAAGEHASALVVQEARKYALLAAKWFFRLDDPDEDVRLRLLCEELERIDQQLIRQGEGDAALAGMGSTLTAACSIGADLFLVHVGDSRAYLCRGGKLVQLTTDHTLAQKMVETGLLRPEAARTARVRHILTNVLGGNQPGVEGETQQLRLSDGDCLLLCTDGLTEMVNDEQIVELLRLHPRPDAACQALVNAALNHGGRDNITVVLAAYSIRQNPG